MLLGAFAAAIGRGGIGLVAAAAGTARCTVSIGAQQIRDNSVPTGVKTSKAERKAVPIVRHQFHGEWNYTILSGQKGKTLTGKDDP